MLLDMEHIENTQMSDPVKASCNGKRIRGAEAPLFTPNKSHRMYQIYSYWIPGSVMTPGVTILPTMNSLPSGL